MGNYSSTLEESLILRYAYLSITINSSRCTFHTPNENNKLLWVYLWQNFGSALMALSLCTSLGRVCMEAFQVLNVFFLKDRQSNVVKHHDERENSDEGC